MAKAYDLPKDSADVARYWYDFGPVMSADETITGTPQVTIVMRGSEEAADLEVIGNPTVVGQTVFAVLTGGSTGKSYEITFEITTSHEQIFNRAAILKVKDL